MKPLGETAENAQSMSAVSESTREWQSTARRDGVARHWHNSTYLHARIMTTIIGGARLPAPLAEYLSAAQGGLKGCVSSFSTTVVNETTSSLEHLKPFYPHQISAHP